MGDFAVTLPEGAKNLQLDLIAHEDFNFGTAYYPEGLTGDDLEWYQNTTRSWFNSLTPDRRFKWFYYERPRSNYSWAKNILDTHYIKFAQDNDIKLVRGHTLEWYVVDFPPFW